MKIFSSLFQQSHLRNHLSKNFNKFKKSELVEVIKSQVNNNLINVLIF